jgi:hypothetical protein
MSTVRGAPNSLPLRGKILLIFQTFAPRFIATE